jgi:predicted metal-dependent enzyme (double-stranded beta helix superfamily)
MAEDEYYLTSEPLRQFIAHVKQTLAGSAPAQALDRLRPAFSDLLSNRDWLPPAFQEPAAQGGMGGGIASWLLYRAADQSLSLFSLVVPAGVATPVHDHLAWGLVGLYAGEQDEEVFRHRPDDHDEPLELATRQRLRPGDFYVLLPPEGDIHRVRTTSPFPSVSIHLLGNDTGCIWRHTYTPEDGSVRPFRSGWTNVPCRMKRQARRKAIDRPSIPFLIPSLRTSSGRVRPSAVRRT